MTDKNNTFTEAALDYHEHPIAGKVATALTKPCETQDDLSLAYTPGVAAPVRAIVDNAEDVYRYTGKGNLVAVITDGSAVLGLGKVGPLASKPVIPDHAHSHRRPPDLARLPSAGRLGRLSGSTRGRRSVV